MDNEKRFEKITIDLRPFGWGIRDVDVIWPEGHDGGRPGPDSVGTEEIKDGGVHHEDLGVDVEAEEGDIDSIFDHQGQDAGQGGGGDADDEEDLPGGGFADPTADEEGD